MSLARLIATIDRLPRGWIVQVFRCPEHGTDWLVQVGRGPVVVAQGHEPSVDNAAAAAHGALVPILRDAAEREIVHLNDVDLVEMLVGAALERCKATDGP